MVEGTKQQRINELEDGIRRALKISDLWLPDQGELLSEEYAGEAQALASMYHNFKQLLGGGNHEAKHRNHIRYAYVHRGRTGLCER